MVHVAQLVEQTSNIIEVEQRWPPRGRSHIVHDQARARVEPSTIRLPIPLSDCQCELFIVHEVKLPVVVHIAQHVYTFRHEGKDPSMHILEIRILGRQHPRQRTCEHLYAK